MNEREGFPPLPESEGNWCWLLTLGVGLILLGVVALGSVAAMELLAVVVLGPLLIASGILQIPFGILRAAAGGCVASGGGCPRHRRRLPCLDASAQHD